MEVLYQDHYIFVCQKPPGVLSTDEPGGLPSMVRELLGDEHACVRTVHRLDRVVGGVMVLARTRVAASELSRQVREGLMTKEYLAVVRGSLPEKSGKMTDLLLRSGDERKTYVTQTPGKDTQYAELLYETVGEENGLSLLQIRLITGRTHQIRAQLSSRGFPLLGDKKYGAEEACGIALWSNRLGFLHPFTGEAVSFRCPPPEGYPWTEFSPLDKREGLL